MIEKNNIEKQLDSFRKRFYQNLLFSGLFITFSIAIGIILLLSFIEYIGQFGTSVRFALFAFFIASNLFLLYRYIIHPLSAYLGIKEIISKEHAAQKIGLHFPEIGDKLVNLLQLQKSVSGSQSLIGAAVNQREREFSNYDFTSAISFEEVKKYLIILCFPLVLFILLNLSIPSLVRDSFHRIYQYQMPFDNPNNLHFELNNFKNYSKLGSDILLDIKINGKILVTEADLILDDKIIKLNSIDQQGKFNYRINNIQKDISFQIKVGKTYSDIYEIKAIQSPSLKTLTYQIDYPNYTNKKSETIRNNGNIAIAEGSKVKWIMESQSESDALIEIDSTKYELEKTENNFTFSQTISKPTHYKLELRNKAFKQVNESISYFIDCIKDELPNIEAEALIDSVTFSKITFAGRVTDDYGINKLELVYEAKNQQGSIVTKGKKSITIDKNFKEQRFLYNWLIDKNIQSASSINYYIQVWDNDGVNGSKSSKTRIFEHVFPSKNDIEKLVTKESLEKESMIKDIKGQSSNQTQKLRDIENKLKSKSYLSWQDKKELSSIINENKKFEQQLEELKQNIETLNEQKKEISEEKNEELEQKMKQLTELMNELLDEETKKMYEKLEQLLNNETNKNEIDKLLKELAKKEDILNNEMSKMLEMYKQIQLEEKLNKSIHDLEKLAEKQKELSNKTSQKDDKSIEDQKNIAKDFDDIKNQAEEIEKLNNQLEEKNELGIEKQELQNVSDDLKKIEQQLQNNQKSAKGNQEKAANNMQKLAQQMKEAKEGNEIEQQKENIKDLRNILENLIQLSFEQENIMNGFKGIHSMDPQYVGFSKRQLKLKSDSKIVSDSLNALSRRVFEIKSFVSRELNNMNSKIDESIDAIKSKRPDLLGAKQQFAMTAMNNLALMLDDALKQMQEQMMQAQQKQGSGSKSCKKPNNSPGKKLGLSEMQKQLGASMEQLLKSGKQPGKEMSEQLAKMAAMQDYIRKKLSEMESKQKKDGGKNAGGNSGELQKEMEKNIEEMVNKKLNQQSIERQKLILTRLLESEKALEEREQDEERKGEQAKETQAKPPKTLENYFKKKEMEVDMLNSIPPTYNQFYKQETYKYFNRIL